mmetsp:Transcript_12406/g.13954  ORF Transcript_12406/g.13954 Transcript_12406/m.13954 type:complete len:89 (-) Transcript_12406:214-480(-)
MSSEEENKSEPKNDKMIKNKEPFRQSPSQCKTSINHEDHDSYPSDEYAESHPKHFLSYDSPIVFNQPNHGTQDLDNRFKMNQNPHTIG